MTLLIILVSLLAWYFWYQLKEESINQDWWIEERISNFQIFLDIIISFIIWIWCFWLFLMLVAYLQQNWLLGNNTFYNYIGYIIFIIVFYLSLKVFIQRHNVFTKKEDIKSISEWITVYFFVTYIILQFILAIFVSFWVLSDTSSIERYMSDIEKVQNNTVSEYIKEVDYKIAEYIKESEKKKIYNNEEKNIKDENSLEKKITDDETWNILIDTSVPNIEDDIKNINEQLDKKVTDYISENKLLINNESNIDTSDEEYTLSKTVKEKHCLFNTECLEEGIEITQSWSIYIQIYWELKCNYEDDCQTENHNIIKISKWIYLISEKLMNEYTWWDLYHSRKFNSDGNIIYEINAYKKILNPGISFEKKYLNNPGSYIIEKVWDKYKKTTYWMFDVYTEYINL